MVPRQSTEQAEEIERLRVELAEVTAERDDYRDTVDALLGDCDRYLKRIKQLEMTSEKRDRILAALGVGKQSPQYKRVKSVLDQLMNDT